MNIIFILFITSQKTCKNNISISWYLMIFIQYLWGFPDDKASGCQCRRHKRHRFNPWVKKIPWRREWLHSPVFLPGKIPRTEELGRLEMMGSQRLRHNWAHTHTHLVPVVETSMMRSYMILAETPGYWLLDNNLILNTTERPQLVGMIPSGSKTKIYIEHFKLSLCILVVLNSFQMSWKHTCLLTITIGKRSQHCCEFEAISIDKGCASLIVFREKDYK